MFSLQTSPGSTSRSHRRRSETNPDAQRQNICYKCERGAEDERPEHHERLEPLETRRETHRNPEQPLNTDITAPTDHLRLQRNQITPAIDETRHIKNRFTSSVCFTKRFQHKLIPVIHRNTAIKDGSLFLPQNIKSDFFLKIQSNKLTIAISHLTIIILIFFLTVLNLHLTILFSFHHGKKINNNNNKCNATLFHNSDFFFPIAFTFHKSNYCFFPTKLCYKLIIPSLHLAIFTFFSDF